MRGILGFSGFRKGDVALQIGQIGLAPIIGFPRVLDVTKVNNEERLLLSKEDGGPPITDLQGNPRWYSARRFRRIWWM